MSMQGVQELVGRYINDPTFREQMRTDPEAAAQGSGVDLSPEEMQALKSLDWKLSDEELRERFSFGSSDNCSNTP